MRRVALITGSATGLGRRIAIELAKQSRDVAINYILSGDKARELGEVLRDNYQVEAIAVQGDVAKFSEARQAVQKTIDSLGPIDILVNNTGPYIFRRKAMVDHEIEEWHHMIDGNLSSAFYVSKLVIPQMRQNGWGRIINIGFGHAEMAPGWAFRSAYAAAKVGLVSLTRTLALEEARHGITVNMVCPGDIRGKWKEADIRESRENPEPAIPVGRRATGEDIARVVAFLCDEDSDFITGDIVSVTGAEYLLDR